MSVHMENPAAVPAAGGVNACEKLSNPRSQNVALGVAAVNRGVNGTSRGRALSRLRDLRDIINGRGEHNVDFDSIGFMCANALTLFPSGWYREPGMEKFEHWPEADIDGALGSKRRGLSEDSLDAIARGLHRGEAWTRRNRRLVSDREVARRLGVTRDERAALGLRTIGAVDATLDDLKKDARDRRRLLDRERKEAKRRAAGVPTLAERRAGSAVEEARREGVSISTIFRRRRAALTHVNSQADTVSSAHNRESLTAEATVSRPIGDHAQGAPVPALQSLEEGMTATSSLAPPPAMAGEMTLSARALSLVRKPERNHHVTNVADPAPARQPVEPQAPASSVRTQEPSRDDHAADAPRAATPARPTRGPVTAGVGDWPLPLVQQACAVAGIGLADFLALSPRDQYRAYAARQEPRHEAHGHRKPCPAVAPYAALGLLFGRLPGGSTAQRAA